MVRRRHDGGSSYLFALNGGPEAVTVSGHGVDLLSGERASGSVPVAAGRAVVLREDGG